MFDSELPNIEVSLRGQLNDDGVTDVLVLTCNDPVLEVSTEISLVHEAMHILFPIVVAFMLRESPVGHLLSEVQKVADGMEDEE